MSESLITPSALKNMISEGQTIVILDATFGTPDPAGGFQLSHIAGALIFDVDAVADHQSPYPHTLPSAEEFAAAAGALGIDNDTTVVVYDQNGITFAAARVWWMFRVFGHENIRVLNGGLPAWIAAGMDTESGLPPVPAPKTFTARFHADLYRSFEDVEDASENGSEVIFDARGAPRFMAPARTPDGDIVPSHIPGSINLPFAALLTTEGCMKDRQEIAAILEDYGFNLEKKTIVSCGSGITACVLALGFFQTGQKNTAVFDGSWTEWSDRQGIR